MRRIKDADEQATQMLLQAYTAENLALLQDEISEVYGFECPPFTIKESSRATWIESEPIDISNEPVLSSFIDEIHITTANGNWGYPDDGMVIATLDVAYEHHGGGSNGHEIGVAYFDVDNGYWNIETNVARQERFQWLR